MKHGGLTDALRRRVGAGEIFDASVNVNPYGPAPEILDAVRSAPLGVYPDPRGAAARDVLAASLDTDPRSVLIGAGAVELLWAAVRAFCGPGRSLLVAEPTFSEARAAACACGAPVVEWRASAEGGFAWELEPLASAIAQTRPAAVYLCTPQNPTGVALPADEVTTLARRFPASVFVVDQSFLALSHRFEDERVALPANAIALRSLTKIHALPGLRLGYALCAPPLASAIDAQRPPWSVSAPALAAVEVIASQPALAARARERMLADAADLTRRLAAVDLSPVPSSTVYSLLDVRRSAAPVVEQLLTRRRVLVRDATSFGLPSFVRVAAQPAGRAGPLVEALAATLAQSPPDV